jgi:hypothetical protein
VDIEIVFAGWISSSNVLEVSGYTGSVIESGGVCTVTADRPGGRVIVSRDALEDRTITTCGTIDIPADKLQSGSYDVTLTYQSAKYEGSSAKIRVEVTK